MKSKVIAVCLSAALFLGVLKFWAWFISTVFFSNAPVPQGIWLK
jgi:hypothetical protein